MLIAIAGTIGAGKSTVARAVSARLGVPFHAIDDDKRVIGKSYPDFAKWVADSTPFPDSFRLAVFDRALLRLSELAKEHEHVIVEETFHRRHLRQPFFNAASETMGGIILIEIAVTRSVALAHLAKRAANERDHLAGPGMYDAFSAIADPLDDVDLSVSNDGDLDETVDRVCRYVQKTLGGLTAF